METKKAPITSESKKRILEAYAEFQKRILETEESYPCSGTFQQTRAGERLNKSLCSMAISAAGATFWQVIVEECGAQAWVLWHSGDWSPKKKNDELRKERLYIDVNPGDYFNGELISSES